MIISGMENPALTMAISVSSVFDGNLHVSQFLEDVRMSPNLVRCGVILSPRNG